MTRFTLLRAAALMASLILAMAALTPVQAASASLVPPVTAARQAQEIEVRGVDLPRGAGPAISWLALNAVHTPNGQAHELPWTRRAAEKRHLTLRGRTALGWVVTDFAAGKGTHAWVVQGEEKRQVDLASTNTDEHTWFVARDGSTLLRRGYTWGDTFASELVRSLSDGAIVDNQDFDAPGLVHDFTGDTALLAVGGDTVLWRPGGEVTPVGSPSVAGSIAHDVLIVPGETPGTVGPTTISDPGAPSWSEPLERVEVSPDGRFLLGLVTGDGRGDGKHIEVRRMSDGDVVAAYHARGLWRLTVQWEGPVSIIFQVARGVRREHELGEMDALVHCHLGKRCMRATSWFASRNLSMVRAPQIVS